MAKQFNIEPNDPDLLLAQAIGRALPDLKDLETSDDLFLNSLLQFRSEETNTQKDLELNSEQIWSQIDQQISHTTDQKKARLLPLKSNLFKYAAAAIILIMAFSGVFYYQQNYVPVLVGESVASIERFTLDDGTTITLRPYSKLYRKSKNSAHAYTLNGEGYFQVVNDPARIFSVETDISRIEVLGTTFNLSSWGERTQVYLNEGSVRVESLIEDESLVLEPGEKAEIGKGISLRKSSADPEVYEDWLNSEMRFENAGLSYIFKELEQHFNIRIKSDLSSDKLSGTIVLDNREQVFQDLSLLLDGTFRQTDTNTFEFMPN